MHDQWTALAFGLGMALGVKVLDMLTKGRRLNWLDRWTTDEDEDDEQQP